MKRLLLLLLLLPALAAAQPFPDGNVVYLSGTADPVGACIVGTEFYRTDTATRFSCVDGTWSAYSAGTTYPLTAPVTCSPPQYGFTGDADTGFCSSAADTLDLKAGTFATMQYDRAQWSVFMQSNVGDAATAWSFTSNLGQTTTFALGGIAVPFQLVSDLGIAYTMELGTNGGQIRINGSAALYSPGSAGSGSSGWTDGVDHYVLICDCTAGAKGDRAAGTIRFTANTADAGPDYQVWTQEFEYSVMCTSAATAVFGYAATSPGQNSVTAGVLTCIAGSSNVAGLVQLGFNCTSTLATTQRQHRGMHNIQDDSSYGGFGVDTCRIQN